MVVASEACGGVEFPGVERSSKSTAIAADPMSLWNHYYLAESVEDALQVLAEAKGNARVIAGGTDLLLDLQQGRQARIDTLVDINRIEEIGKVELRGETLSIGAITPLSSLSSDEFVKFHAQALVEACGLIGGPQVRNTATLGGNVAHALPAGDGSIALLALGAKAEVASSYGNKILPLNELFLGPGETALRLDEEILVRFLVPARGRRQGSAFKRVMRPQGVALPVLNVAVWVQRSEETEEDLVNDIRIAIGPAGTVPFRAMATEEYLCGRGVDEDSLKQAKEILLGEAHFRTSPRRATAEYRQHLSGVLFEQALLAAWERASTK